MLICRLPLVALWSWVTSSVLNTEVKIGSPSSEAVVLKAIQSSRRLDRPTDRIVTSGTLRSIVVEMRPSLADEMRK